MFRYYLRFLIFVMIINYSDCRKKKKNILFIVADDLRPQLNAFLKMENQPIRTYPKMHTPNLDKLADESLVFRRAYCQYPLCSPSRTSFLTGRRPDTTKIYDLRTYFRKVGGDFTTIPQFFKEKGYMSYGVGKIFHQGSTSGNDDPVSWTEKQSTILDKWAKQSITWKSLTDSELETGPLHDSMVTEQSLKLLDKLGDLYKAEKQNFFLAVGYRKPHIPFTAPESFFKLYPDADIRIPENWFAPVNMPSIIFGKNWEFTGRDMKYFPNKINQTLPIKEFKEVRKAYYAATSYMDDEVGKVLRRLKENKLDENTIIVFFGDHGYHLGENAAWGKRHDLELDERVPLMLHIPGKTDGGIVTDELVELVDVFPTLVQAAGFNALEKCPQDSSKVKLCSEGNSLLPLVKKPVNSDWKKAVFSQVNFPHMGKNGDYKLAGYTVHTNRYRYTEWYPFNGPTLTVNWNQLYTVQLYDHKKDPGETYNIPLQKFSKKVVKKLHDLIITFHKNRRPDLIKKITKKLQ